PDHPVVAQLGQGAMYDVLAYSPTRNWIQLDLGFTTAWVFRHLGTVYSASGVVSEANTPTTTVTVTNASLGQGGGGKPATVVVNTIIDAQTSAEFNSTIGVLGNLNLRAGPSTTFRILWRIPYDERATPIGRTATGSWIQVDYEGTVGWVSARYIAVPPSINIAGLPVTG
ncbi:MAG: SH3 domain-containing protein, partial [Chloroflexota bacterium]